MPRPPQRRRPLPLILVLFAMILAATPIALAQNENETVGFQSNHIFEGGQFGENIDLLNGGLNLSIPIGPHYQVTQHLGYQLNLAYNSKVWEQGFIDGMGLARQGSMGLGFGLNFGRIYRDISQFTASGTYLAECKWYYVSPDGNEHMFEDDPLLNPCDGFPGSFRYAKDGSFFYIDGDSAAIDAWSLSPQLGDPATAPVLHIYAPDGTVYEFAHLVQVWSGGWPMDGSLFSNGVPDATRRYNHDFGGWYVTKIWNGKSGTSNYISISYDTRPGYEHVISGITDTVGRSIAFTNQCQSGQTCGSCTPPPPGGHPSCNEPGRQAVKTTAITLPVFNGTTGISNSTTATYNLTFDFLQVDSQFFQFTNQSYGPTLLLRRIDYPQVATHGSGSQQYSMPFVYATGGNGHVLGGEILERSLPSCPPAGPCATIDYGWSSYGYIGLDANSARPGISSETRTVVTKTQRALPTDPGDVWTYTRESQETGTVFTNPKYTIVRDPMGNETQYYYHASYRLPASGIYVFDPDDGFAPEWSDGTNYLTEHYVGHGTGRVLLRTESTDFDADQDTPSHHLKQNVRAFRNVTTYVDHQSQTATVSRSEWDGLGHWKTTTESGDGIDGTRTTRRDYFAADPDQYHYEEVSDGPSVIARTDNWYSGGLLMMAVRRLNLPSAPRTTFTGNSIPAGDVVTLYSYDSAGDVIEKDITDHGATFGTGWTLTTPEYKIQYTWQAGGYLLTKQFYNWTTGSYFSWKAIDRSRDGNTGLIYASRDPAGVQTQYAFDALGRLTDINPTSPEYPTQIEYRDAQHTTVRQGNPTVMGSDYSCSNAAGDYIMSCYEYDTLGRLTKTQKRPANPPGGIPYQTTAYNALGWKTFESEWTYPGSTAIGTTYDYGQPNDPTIIEPFGRVRKVTTPTGATNPVTYSTTETTYSGLGSTVTIHGVAGPGGVSLDATTSYERDPWGRLVAVYPPQAGSSGHGTADSGGSDAFYGYDLRDNLIGVDMVDSTNLVHQRRAFEYDPLGRLRSSFNPESGSQSIVGYDPLGNVTDSIDASGNHQLLAYDGAGRLLQVSRKDYQKPGGPAPTAILLAQNSYDQTGGAFGTFTAGKLTTTQDYDETGTWVHTLERHYDQTGPNGQQGLNGRITGEVHTYARWTTGTGPGVLGYEYTNFGLLDTLTYPEGLADMGGFGRLAYSYSNGYPTGVWDWAKNTSKPTLDPLTAMARLTYNAAGGVLETFTAGGTRDFVAPDARNRPGSITIGQWDSGTQQYTSQFYASGAYLYDGAGNISAIGSNTYGYDAGNRLLDAHDVADVVRHQTFGYDDFGNMTAKNLYDGSETLLSSDSYFVRDQSTGTTTNRLLSHQSTQGSSTFVYDPRGNVVQGDNLAYQMDARNRVLGTRAITGSTQTDVARYLYDASANRFRKEELGADLYSFYVRDGQGRLMSEFRRTRGSDYVPEFGKHYIYLGDRLVGMRGNRRPAPPGLLKATINKFAKTVTLTWSPPPPNENITYTSYNVYRSLNTTPPSYSFRGSTSSLSYTDTYTTNNVIYAYLVTPVDYEGNEGYGTGALTVVTGDITPPNPPTGLVGTAGDHGVELIWNQNVAGEAVVGYHVYRAIGTGSAVRITQTPTVNMKPSSPGSQTYVMTFTDQVLTNGTTYRYSVSAVDSAANESTHSGEVSLVPADYTPPDAPRYVQALADCSTSAVTVSWEPSPGFDAVSYKVFRTPAWDQGPSTTVTGTSLNDLLTTAGSPYVYYVSAVDGGGNISVPSMNVGVTTRASSGQVAMAPTPFLNASDGKVTLNVVHDFTTASTRVYRKRNTDLGCTEYELVTEMTASGVFVDGAVTNGVAYDYSLTNTDSLGHESAFSAPALAMPVARPQNVTACIEELPGWADGAVDCGWNTAFNPTQWRRLVLRWTSLPTAIYQPYTDHSEGTPGYLKGYRAYRYTVHSGNSGIDQSTLTSSLDDYNIKSSCSLVPEQVCGGYGYIPGSPVCPSGDTCAPQSDGTIPDGYGECTPNATPRCMTDSDCPTGSSCKFAPVDAALLRYADGKYNTGFRVQSGYPACLGLKAVYKIFANGTWLTVESDFNDNTAETGAIDMQSRCIRFYPDVCSTNLKPGGFDADLICPAVSSLPQAPAVPTTATPGPGSITVSWAAPPSPGTCALASPSNCGDSQYGACPTTNTPPQYCSSSDGYKCRLAVPAACSTAADCSQTPPEVCVLNSDSQIASYRLYVSERAIDASNNHVLSDQYHFSLPSPVVLTFDSNTTSYTFTGMTNQLYNAQTAKFSFRVATVDTQGRVSEPSPATAVVTPTAASPQPPESVRAVIWTLNDRGKDKKGGTSTYSNPRNANGIKISWRDGTSIGATFLGYRVWRLTPQNTWCALLKPGTQQNPNPPGVSLCTNDVAGGTGDSNAYSEIYTTGPTGANRVYVDYTAAAGVTYDYSVTVIYTNGQESPHSQTIGAMALPHATGTPTTPAYLTAQAPDGFYEWPGIYLHWCPNAAAEGVTGYKVYRSTGYVNQSGPFTYLATIDATCLNQGKRCEITSVGQSVMPSGTCTAGSGGTCSVVDLTVSYPPSGNNYTDQVANYSYNYVITAVHDLGGGNMLESGFSMMNRGWPNYHDNSTYSVRYDPDPVQDTPCGDEDALLIDPDAPSEGNSEETAVASLEPEIAPYRAIGVLSDPLSPRVAVIRITYFHLDHLGTPRVITDSTGALISSHHYMPFGEEMPFVAQGSTNKKQFTGHERDPETGADYMMARYYSSGLGRFTASDPGNDTALDQPQSLNHYSYVNNNPLLRVDPSGTMAVEQEVVWSTDPFINHVNASNNQEGTVWPAGTTPSQQAAAAACNGHPLCDGGEGGGGGEGNHGEGNGSSGGDPSGNAPEGSYVEHVTVTASPDSDPGSTLAMGGYHRIIRTPPPPRGGNPRVTPPRTLPEEPYPAPGIKDLMAQRGWRYWTWQLVGRIVKWFENPIPPAHILIVTPNPCFANPSGPGCGGSFEAPPGGA